VKSLHVFEEAHHLLTFSFTFYSSEVEDGEGIHACRYNKKTISKNSCHGKEACEDEASYDPSVEPVVILDKSCVGERSCR